MIRGQWADLRALEPAVTADRWEVRPIDGVSPDDYRSKLGDTTDAAANIGIVSDGRTD